MKYRLNRYTEAVNILINNGVQIKDTLTYPKGTTYYNLLFKQLNLLPDGITYVSEGRLQDSWFKNRIHIYNSNGKDGSFGGIRFDFQPSKDGSEVCRSAVYAAKENSANLWVVETYKYLNDDTFTAHGWINGDKYCTKGAKCLKNLKLSDINGMCNDCNEKACALFVLWQTSPNTLQ